MEEEFRQKLSEFTEIIDKRCTEVLNRCGILTNRDVIRIIYEELRIPLVPEDFEKYGYSWEMKPAIVDDECIKLGIEP